MDISVTKDEMNVILALRKILKNGNDLEIRNAKTPGEYKVFEVKKNLVQVKSQQ